MPWRAPLQSFFRTLVDLHSSQWIRKQTVDFHIPHSLLEFLISQSCESQSLKQSMQIHSQLITTGLHREQLDKTGLLICNSLLRQYSQGEFPGDALQLYRQMQESKSTSITCDSFTFSFLLKACTNLSKPDKGVQIHGHVFKVGFEAHVYVQTALINMYAVCRFLPEAIRVFDNMPVRNSVTWNVMITGLTRWGEIDLAVPIFIQMPFQTVIAWTGMIDAYTRINQPLKALSFFNQMMNEGIKPTAITILSIVPAISNMGNLSIAESVHSHVEKNASTLDIRVTNSLIDMYAKCGCIENALQVFQDLNDRRNLVSWTSIISAFASHGMSRDAVEYFQEMKAAGTKPNKVTFLSVLNACSHGGLVEEGLKFFSALTSEFGITPEIKHYGCMIDMLGRSGRLDEAEKMLQEMPVKENVIVWRTLLGACSLHGDIEMGERVMYKISEIEKMYGGDYVLLSNIFAAAGRFDDAERTRSHINERNVLKVPGLSFMTE